MTAKLGDIVEFNSTHWNGAIFGKIDCIYLEDNKPIEYWVDHIDHSDFTPDQLIRIVEASDWKWPELIEPKFRIGDIVKNHDGERTALIVVKGRKCRVDEEGITWWYSFGDTDYLGNKLTWGEELEEAELELFKV